MITPDPKHSGYLAGLAETVKEQRRFLGWTKSRLSTASGYSAQEIKRLESGVVSPMSYTVRRLAEALHLEHWELLRMVEERIDGGQQ